MLTGGSGGGKTTAADLFRREIGDRVVMVPRGATILFQGGFPPSTVGLAALESLVAQIACTPASVRRKPARKR